jgi:large subunit ribosomal protein L4
VTLSLAVQDPTSGKAAEAAKAKVTLPPDVFDVPTNLALIHQVVVAQLAAARRGTASTKTRGEVRGGGKKPYRQKGTGRARQGSTRAPQFTGGGVVHGPRPRTYVQRTPKKMKAAALRGALSDRARNDRVHVVSALVDVETPSTKAAAAALARITERRHVLVVAERTDEVTWKSLRNIQSVHLLEPGQLNTYDVLVSDDVVFTEGALQAFLGGSVVIEVPEAEPDTEPELATEPDTGATAKAPAKKAAAKKATAAPADKPPAKKAPAKKAEAAGEADESSDEEHR